MSNATQSTFTIAPQAKESSYYDSFPSKVNYKGGVYSETNNVSGRWCESEVKGHTPHGPLPTCSSYDRTNRGHTRYAGGRWVARDTCEEPGLFTGMGIKHVREHEIGLVKGETQITDTSVCVAHAAAVKLAEVRKARGSLSETDNTLLETMKRKGEALGPEDWFVYEKEGSAQGDGDQYIHSECGTFLYRAGVDFM